MSSYNRLLLHRLADIFGYSPFLDPMFCVISFPLIVGKIMFLLKNVLSHMFSTSVGSNHIMLFDRFSHESVGEGDDRHLILERCPETSMYVKILTNITEIS